MKWIPLAAYKKYDKYTKNELQDMLRIQSNYESASSDVKDSLIKALWILTEGVE